MKVFTANQPLCLGGQIYMGNRYAQCDVLVHMTTAQFTKFGHQSRIELMDRQGKKFMFIIDLRDRSFKPLNQVMLMDHERTLDKLLKTVQSTYGKAPFYSEVRPLLEDFCNRVQHYPECSLSTFNTALMNRLYGVLLPGLGIAYDDDLLLERPEHPSAWVAAMGHAVKAQRYIGGGTAKGAYVRDEDFSTIEYVVQDFKMPTYERKGGVASSDGMVSILDPLCYLGVEGTRKLIGG